MILASKVKLFQTKIRFLMCNIHQSKVSPIGNIYLNRLEKSLEVLESKLD
jgi:hypothetical protein